MAHEEDGDRLVLLARDAIVRELGGPELERPAGPWFEQLAATFVTVTHRGRLHGCIGSIAARRPLAEDVAQNAVAAAFADPRSPPFQLAWLPHMGLEVTLLSALERIEFSDEADLLRKIVPFRDGLVLRHGSYRGTFLPQVWESLPTPRAFLDELKIKAGLFPAFWADGVEIRRFHAQKWGDRRALPSSERPSAQPAS